MYDSIFPSLGNNIIKVEMNFVLYHFTFKSDETGMVVYLVHRQTSYYDKHPNATNVLNLKCDKPPNATNVLMRLSVYHLKYSKFSEIREHVYKTLGTSKVSSPMSTSFVVN